MSTSPRDEGRERSQSPVRNSRSQSRSRSPARGGDEGRRLKGTAARWNERGFGFIKPEDGGDDVFCHFSAIQDGNCLAEGSLVEYEASYDENKGKYRAENVTGGQTEDRRGGGGGGGGRPRGECYDFKAGNCTRGDSCRFSHDGGDDRRGGGGYDDRRGGYDDRRGGYEDRRGGGGYDDRRGGGYDDRRGGKIFSFIS